MKPEPEWWETARQLRDLGYSLREIGKLVGRDAKAVHMALDPEKRAQRYAYWRQWDIRHKAKLAAQRQ